MPYETLIVERRGHVVLITLNRPQSMNAINAQLWREAGAALEQFSKDPDSWVAVITGAGDKSFCAGDDLKEHAAGRSTVPDDAAHWGFAGIVRHYISKPIIAAVNGYAYGGGMEIVLACDLVVACETATFALPEVKRGTIAAAGGLLRLPRQIPLKVAMNTVLTGRPLTAAEAERWGLVNLIVPRGKVVAAAMTLAEMICENAPLSVRASKEIIYRGLDMPLDHPPAAWDMNERFLAEIHASEDRHEGARAFADKRKPAWKGR